MIRPNIRHALPALAVAALLSPAFAAPDSAPAMPASADTTESPAPQERPAIVGTVTDTDGKPVADAIVFVDTAWPKVGRGVMCPSCYADCAKDATTDAEGRFRITDLDPTLGFNLLVASPRHMPTEHSVSNPGAAPQTIRLQPVKGGETADKRAVARVLDAAGRPVPGATLSIEGFGHGGTPSYGSRIPVQSVAVTDAEGRALIHATEPFDRLTVKVHARGCAPLPTSLRAGDTVQDIRLANGVTVSGKLLHNGKPVAGVELCIAPKDRSSENFVGKQEITTNRDGRFTFACVPAERAFQICATGETVRRLGTFAPREITTGANDSTLGLGDIALVAGHTVAGRVVLADGKPFPPHTRLMLSREDAWGSDITELAPDGAFRFEHVAPGPVRVSLGLGDYRPTAGHSADPSSCTHAIAGRVSGDKADLILRFEPGRRRDVQEVRAAEPLLGAETTLPNPPPEPSAEAVQAGKAEREAKGREQAEWRKRRAESARKFRISGQAVSAAPDSRPIPGARVTIRSVQRFNEREDCYQIWADAPLLGQSTTSDANGRFDLGPNQDDLIVYLTIRAPGYNPAQFRITEAIYPPFELSPATKPEMELPVVITDEAGAPIPKASVRVRSHVAEGKAQYPQGVLPEETDATGSARIPIGKNWDNITLYVTAPKFAPTLSARLHPAAQAQSIRLVRGAMVKGRLLRKGQPFAGITIRAKEENSNAFERLSFPGTVTTDAEGRFRFTNLPLERKFTVSPTMKSLAPYGVISERTVGPLQNGQTLDLGDLQVLDGVKLAGRIYRTDGKTAESISVSIRRSEGSDSVSALCDETGRFCFDHLMPGTVRLDISAENVILTANNPSRDGSSRTQAVGQLMRDKTDLLLELAPLNPGESTWKADFAPLHGVEAAPAAK